MKFSYKCMACATSVLCRVDAGTPVPVEAIRKECSTFGKDATETVLRELHARRWISLSDDGQQATMAREARLRLGGRGGEGILALDVAQELVRLGRPTGQIVKLSELPSDLIRDEKLFLGAAQFLRSARAVSP